MVPLATIGFPNWGHDPHFGVTTSSLDSNNKNTSGPHTIAGPAGDQKVPQLGVTTPFWGHDPHRPGNEASFHGLSLKRPWTTGSPLVGRDPKWGGGSFDRFRAVIDQFFVGHSIRLRSTLSADLIPSGGGGGGGGNQGGRDPGRIANRRLPGRPHSSRGVCVGDR